MGIHNFHKWLKECNPKCYTLIDKPISIDYVYIDINFALHNCIYGTKSYSVLIKKLMGFIENIIENVVPKKGLILATDGPAPFAKLLLQRKRRLQMVRKLDMDNVQDNTITPLWFTPGTNFMINFHKDLKDLFDKISKKFKIVIETLFSGQDEAELKLVRSIMKKKENNNLDTHIIISNDADVIVMISAIKNFKNISVGIKTGKYIEVIHIESIFENNISHADFALLSIMMGNDYLPKIMCVTFEKLWKAYNKTVKKLKTTLIVDDQINYAFMKELMLYISAELHTSWVNKLQLGNLNSNMYQNYLEGLLWCFDVYSTGICSRYDYMYSYTLPHPLGIYYYLRFYKPDINLNNNITKTVPHILPELCALMLLPKKAKCLINKKYHNLIETKLKFMYEEEDCQTCVDFHSELSSLSKSYTFMQTMGEDTDIVCKKMGQISSKMGKHKKIHKELSISDIHNILSIIKAN